MKLPSLILACVLAVFVTACSQAQEVKSLMGDLTIAVKTDKLSVQQSSIVLGLGCFWGAEKKFALLPGVIDVKSGYADGRGFDATYRNITQRKHKFNPDNYAEVIEVTFNPEQISLSLIFRHFFELHDPTQQNRQGNDIGTQYRSTILYNSPAEKQVALEVQAQYQTLLTKAGFDKITTKLAPLDKFHAAETYHQDYLVKNPNGYCPDHSTGVRFDKTKDKSREVDNTAILSGQHIVIIDSEFCPYCDLFKKDVANNYSGSVPMHFRKAMELEGLDVTTPTWATPTILFMQDGVEQYGIQGYVNNKDFYKALGYFKLGKSEAFNVAFNEGTDSRYCKQYELFKNTPDGKFIDKLSGIALFDTDDRFNSGSGWLSFTKPIEGTVTYVEDNRFGMQRTEVRAKDSDIHLGHVFDDGPNGSKRYCINATVLDFVAD